jgi:hypothetical protein
MNFKKSKTFQFEIIFSFEDVIKKKKTISQDVSVDTPTVVVLTSAPSCCVN